MENNLEVSSLFLEIKQLIEQSKNKIAVSVNSEMSLLYWNIGNKINSSFLENKRAEYGKHIVAILAGQLHTGFGSGWSEKQLRHCLRFVEVFPNFQIVSTLSRQLSWSHFKELIPITDI